MSLAPWLARPLAIAAKDEHFQEVIDLHTERAMLGRSALIAGWTIGGVGVVCLLASAVTVASLFPLKTVKTEFWLADQSTGIISRPVSIEDAPKTFTQAQDQQYLRRYIETRMGWVWEMDPANDHVVKVMSSPDEQERVAEKRKLPTHPALALGKDGHIEVSRFRFHPMANGRAGTRSYLVQFDLITTRGSTEDTKPWSATVEFQWHPELPMTPDDRTINPGGMQVISFSANPDTPDPRRQ